MILKKLFITLRTKGVLILYKSLYYYILRKIYLKLNKNFIYKNIYNFKMKLYVEQVYQNFNIIWSKRIRSQIHAWKILKRGMNVLDIGSNIGYYLLIERKIIGDNGKL